mmetsp:Transcript_3488/g.6554  ORF Transcript_3488/g.6554 Transcript_3488/m.6554 type:complete len:97 (-) Transcript_3488:1249-1539(-)
MRKLGCQVNYDLDIPSGRMVLHNLFLGILPRNFYHTGTFDLYKDRISVAAVSSPDTTSWDMQPTDGPPAEQQRALAVRGDVIVCLTTCPHVMARCF